MKKVNFQVQVLHTSKRKHNGVTEYTIQYCRTIHPTYEQAFTDALHLSGGILYTKERMYQIIAVAEGEL